MKSWAWMLSGLIVWTIHFVGVYAIASVADIAADPQAPVWRVTGWVFSAACALATAVMLALAIQRLRRPADEPFRHEMALMSNLVGLIAIAWQALPFAF